MASIRYGGRVLGLGGWVHGGTPFARIGSAFRLKTETSEKINDFSFP